LNKYWLLPPNACGERSPSCIGTTQINQETGIKGLLSILKEKNYIRTGNMEEAGINRSKKYRKQMNGCNRHSTLVNYFQI
jgi:hypothetical protein